MDSESHQVGRMTLGDDGVVYGLRSRNVCKTEPKTKMKTKTMKKKTKEQQIPWWLKVNTNGKPVDGWLVRPSRCSSRIRFDSSRKWFIHPSRIPAKWGPYILPNGNFDRKTFMRDLDFFLGDLIPVVTPSDLKREAQEVADQLPTECAKAALVYYNKKNEDTDFVLVKAVDLNSLVCRGIWFHINFEAKPRDADCTDPSANLLFFAELILAKPNKMKVTTCVALDSDDSGGIHCIFCQSMGKKICHPAQEFQRGFTFTGVTRPHHCHPLANSDGIFDFDKCYFDRYDMYHAPKPPRRPAQERKKRKDASRVQNTQCAKTALAHYNKEMKKDFVLVEATLSNGFIHVQRSNPCRDIYYHANFKAKPRNANCGDSSPKLFFAELCMGKKRMKATLCSILEPSDFGDHRCRYCGPGGGKYLILHPVDGYKGYLPANGSDMG